MKRRIYKSVATSLGVTLGGVILPRLLCPQHYNQSYPPIYQQAALYFTVGFCVSFLVYLLLESFKTKP